MVSNSKMIGETIICQEANLRCHAGGKIINTAEKDNQAEDCALGDSRFYEDLFRTHPLA